MEKRTRQVLFRNYPAPWDYIDECAIWQACRATSAAPTFFPPIYIGNPPMAYVDGGLGHNNPIRSLIDEAKQLWPSRPIHCILNIGTGITASANVGRTLKPLMDTLKKISTDADQVAREVKREMENEYGIDQTVYFRFNVQQGLEKVGLEEWKKRD